MQRELAEIVEDNFDGSLDRLKTATLDEQAETWYAVFDAAEVEPPPRLTCVLVTLTPWRSKNLAYCARSRCDGSAAWRSSQLAEESGVHSAPSAIDAPCPLNRDEPETIAEAPWRMGGAGGQYGDRRGRHDNAGAFGRLQPPHRNRVVVLLLFQHQDPR